jgi:hypothetical protein
MNKKKRKKIVAKGSVKKESIYVKKGIDVCMYKYMFMSEYTYT